MSPGFALGGWRRAARVAAFIGVVGLALTLPGSAAAKGFTRAVFVGSNGQWVEVHAKESVIDGLLSTRGTVERIRGGYVRLFFVGPGDFPANPARYYPERECVALDWPRYERSCARINPALRQLLRPGSFTSTLRHATDNPCEHHIPRAVLRRDHDGRCIEDSGRAGARSHRAVSSVPEKLLRLHRAVARTRSGGTTGTLPALRRRHLRE